MSNVVVNDNQIYEAGSLLVNGDEVFEIDSLNIYFGGDRKMITPPKDGFHSGVAYLYGENFYPYRGEFSDAIMNIDLFKGMFSSTSTAGGMAGLYHMNVEEVKITWKGTDGNDWIERLYTEDGDSYVIVHPTGIDRDRYLYEGKIKAINPDQIIQDLNDTKEVIQITVPGSNKIFLPEISTDDDLLKRAIKEVLLKKNIDIDQYRYRFTDKNALFNLKQVIKGDAKLSILLFNRACDALNLKYVITITDADDNTPIGPHLEEPIEVSNLDTYDL